MAHEMLTDVISTQPFAGAAASTPAPMGPRTQQLMNQISTASGNEAIEKIEEGMRQARDRLQRVDKQIVRFAKEQPLVAAFSALAVGFIVGRFLSKL
jgi:hypothetical protein